MAAKQFSKKGECYVRNNYSYLGNFMAAWIHFRHDGKFNPLAFGSSTRGFDYPFGYRQKSRLGDLKNYLV